MTRQDRISIVTGYHADTPVPGQVTKLQFGYRFAIIFETAYPGCDSMVFTSVLFMELLDAISRQLGCDQLLIELVDDVTISSLEELGRYYADTEPDEHQPPNRILFMKKGDLICFEETEFWALCGGKLPYSDSYTISFYSPIDMAETLDRICAETCSTSGALIAKRIKGDDKPVQTRRQRLWSRLFNK